MVIKQSFKVIIHRIHAKEMWVSSSLRPPTSLSLYYRKLNKLCKKTYLSICLPRILLAG